MTPLENRTLYHTDRAAWLVHAAPRIADDVAKASTDAELSRRWSTLPRDLQLAAWNHLDTAMRERITRLRMAA
jgi:hypothetical protein